MRPATVFTLSVLAAALVVNCSKFAVGESQTSRILTDAQLAPLAIEPEDDLGLSLRLQARAALAELETRRTF